MQCSAARSKFKEGASSKSFSHPDDPLADGSSLAEEEKVGVEQENPLSNSTNSTIPKPGSCNGVVILWLNTTTDD
jgi:hypothetical protein